jgi:hypothetical protein
MNPNVDPGGKTAKNGHITEEKRWLQSKMLKFYFSLLFVGRLKKFGGTSQQCK